MNDYTHANKKLWNRWAELHARSEFYDVPGFKAGRSSLLPVELEEMGDVQGKSLLHLQCHFGMDTLSWARLGAMVTGVDFSEKAIGIAQSLSDEVGIEATFVQSDIYELPQNLSGQFDVVFTSYGVLWWLPDLQAWAQVVAHFLNPGGTFLLVESHPIGHIFDPDAPNELKVKYPYFHRAEPIRFEVEGSYAVSDPDFKGVEYGWLHSVSEIVNALIAAGLRIESLREYAALPWRQFAFMQHGDDGLWRLPESMGEIPLLFSLKASAP